MGFRQKRKRKPQRRMGLRTEDRMETWSLTAKQNITLKSVSPPFQPALGFLDSNERFQAPKIRVSVFLFWKKEEKSHGCNETVKETAATNRTTTHLCGVQTTNTYVWDHSCSSKHVNGGCSSLGVISTHKPWTHSYRSIGNVPKCWQRFNCSHEMLVQFPICGKKVANMKLVSDLETLFNLIYVYVVYAYGLQ